MVCLSGDVILCLICSYLDSKVSLREFTCSDLSGPEQSQYDHGMRAYLVGMTLPLGRTALLNSISVDYIGSRKIIRSDMTALRAVPISQKSVHLSRYDDDIENSGLNSGGDYR
jgi:hypothetical protein